MPTFPTKEAEVVALVEAMIAGYTAHGADFPSVTVADLQTALSNYQTDKQAQDDAKAQAQIATVTKTDNLDALKELMRNDLKVSEVDVVDDPEKLTQIGWAPKAPPQPVVAPGQPTNLHPTAEGQGMLWLAWDRPASGSGGPVRNYIVERREQPAGGGEFGTWSIVGSALNNDISLTDQPRGIQMEYRAKATNIGGESMPSNTAAVVL
ncbi:MAG TPA: fibronectin type III domain-containing protein [Phycisphaerales bacterium]|nr:fibronectin type III domain-containing protein [Phycisphaerales bacterium]